MRESGRESFETWARSRQQGLVRTAYLLTGDFHRAEDLVQEALVKAAARWDSLAGGSPDAWVRTGFAGDGSWVTWGSDRTLVSSDGTRLQAEAANAGGPQPTSPLVDDEVAVGLGGRDLEQGRTTYADVAGVPVVDRHSGELRAFLYTEGPDTGLLPTYLLGLDGDTVTLAAGVAPDYARLLLLRWNWRTGEVAPMETVEAGMVSGALN